MPPVILIGISAYCCNYTHEYNCRNRLKKNFSKFLWVLTVVPAGPDQRAQHTEKVKVIHGERFAIREELRQTVFEYIEVDYNYTRRHSANSCISPETFVRQQAT